MKTRRTLVFVFSNDSGVVEEDVDVAQLCFRLDEDSFEVVLVADVALHEADVLVAHARLLRRHLVAHHDARPVKSQSGGSTLIQI